MRRGIVPVGTRGASGYAYRLPTDGAVRGVHVRAGADGAPSSIAGFATVWNRYSQNLGGFVEQFAPGAFDRSIDDDDQVATFNHDDRMILGRRSAETLVVASGGSGLEYRISVDAGQTDHMNVARKIDRGDVVGSSFTFDPLPDGMSWSYTEQDMLLCTVSAARLFEVAPVVWPAYPATSEDDFKVGLRSLAEQSGRDVGALIEAATEGRLTEAVPRGSVRPADDSDAVDGATADAEARLRAARARLRLAELQTA